MKISESIKTNRNLLTTGAFFSATLLFLLNRYRDFVLDDSYITYRYANNLARGFGFVWNKADDPVEGFTSFLWVVMNAGAIRCGLDPAIFSKAVSAIAALAIVWTLLAMAGRSDRIVNSIFISALAISPPFAFLAMQGMETVFTSFIIFMEALVCVSLIAKPSSQKILLFFAAAFASMLSRPDSAFFFVGAFLSAAIIFSVRKDYKSLRAMALIAVPFAIAGAAYMAWRLKYFGYLLPNTYYIKTNIGGSGEKMKDILVYLRDFFIRILLPYLILAAYLARRYRNADKFVVVIPILAGFMAHIIYLLGIYPIQGFLWRFIFPVYPALLLAAVVYFREIDFKSYLFSKKPTLAMAAVFFIAWPLATEREAFDQIEWRTQRDRVAVGKALAGLNGRMFITESGALPYYSDWYAVDYLGLNSEEIAHKGLSRELLDGIAPDLVMVYAQKYYTDFDAILNNYMKDNGFEAVAVIRKNETMNHFYFVKKYSPIHDELVERLRNVPETQYGDLAVLMKAEGIPVLEWKK